MAAFHSFLGMTILGALGLTFPAFPAAAQDVQWRHEYTKALQEAKAKNRPIVIDFGTEHCSWCKKLDAETFREPAVVQSLNERFIPLKLDAEHEAELTRSLKIDSFPTLVFAAPNGKILGRHVGYVEVALFQQQLRRALSDSTPQAESRPSVRLSGQALDKEPDDPGTKGVRTTTPPADGTDPDLVRQACEKLEDRLGELYLGLAETCLRQGEKRQAAAYLKRVLLICPGSRHAQAAQASLSRLSEK